MILEHTYIFKCYYVHTRFFHKLTTLCRSSSSSLCPGLVIKKSISCPIFLPLKAMNNKKKKRVKFLLNFTLLSKRIYIYIWLHYKKRIKWLQCFLKHNQNWIFSFFYQVCHFSLLANNLKFWCIFSVVQLDTADPSNDVKSLSSP